MKSTIITYDNIESIVYRSPKKIRWKLKLIDILFGCLLNLLRDVQIKIKVQTK